MKETIALRRILAVLLVVFLVFGMTPNSSFAALDGDKKQADVTAADDDKNGNDEEEIIEEETVVAKEDVISHVDRKDGKNDEKAESEVISEENVINDSNRIMGAFGDDKSISGNKNLFNVTIKKAYKIYSSVSGALAVEMKNSSDAEKYTIEYFLDGEETSSPTCPEVTFEKNRIKVVVTKKDDSTKYEEIFTVEFVDNPTVSWKNSTSMVYAEENKTAVSQDAVAQISGDEAYTFEYSPVSDDDCDSETGALKNYLLSDLQNRTWSESAQYSNAGDYKYYVKAKKKGYFDYYTLSPISFTVEPLTQSIKVENGDSLTYIWDKNNGKTVNFADLIDNSDSLTGGIVYGITEVGGYSSVAELVMSEEDDYSTDPESGEKIPNCITIDEKELIVNKSGEVKMLKGGFFNVVAYCKGDANHTSCRYVFGNVCSFVSGDPVIYFSGDNPLRLEAKNDSIVENSLVYALPKKCYKFDDDEYVKFYFDILQNEEDLPISIDDKSGKIKIEDYDRFIAKIGNSKDQEWEVTVAADCPEFKYDNVTYPESTAKYTIEFFIKEEDTGDAPIVSLTTKPESGWYTGPVTVTSTGTYADSTYIHHIDKNGAFFEEVNDNRATFTGEEGTNIYQLHFRPNNRNYCCAYISLGKLSFDTQAPSLNRVEYLSAKVIDNVNYYKPNADIQIKVETSDATSGVQKIQWSVIDMESETRACLAGCEDVTVTDFEKLTNGHCVYTFSVPNTEEFIGRLDITVFDKAGNSVTYKDGFFTNSDKEVDISNLVIDGTAPVVKAFYIPIIPDEEMDKLPEDASDDEVQEFKDSFNAKEYEGDSRKYYRTSLGVDVVVYEKNFNVSNPTGMLTMTVYKDGGNGVLLTNDDISFSQIDSSSDYYQAGVPGFVGRLTWEEEGDYKLVIKAKDYSGNEDTSYAPEEIVIDKTAPEIEVDLSSPKLDKYSGDFIYYGLGTGLEKDNEVAQVVADVRIYERNFEAGDVELSVEAVESGETYYSSTLGINWSNNDSSEGETDDDDDDDDDLSNDFNHLGAVISSAVDYIFGHDYGNHGGNQGGSDDGNQGGNDDGNQGGNENPDKNEIKHQTNVIISSGKKNVTNNFGDGTYYINIKYADRAGNVMTYTVKNDKSGDLKDQGEFGDNDSDEDAEVLESFRSKGLVLDTKCPVIKVQYPGVKPNNTLPSFKNANIKYDYYNRKSLTSEISVEEKNFYFKDFSFGDIHANDVTGNNSIPYGDILPSEEKDWTSEGDMHRARITYDKQANYDVSCSATDMAGNEGKSETSYFTLDCEDPTIKEIKFSTPILDTVLNGISFGFYNGKIDVTVIAEDTIAGVHEFNYSYVKAAGVSNVNTELLNQIVSEEKITYEKEHRDAVIKFSIPKDALDPNHQFNGVVKVSASDRSDNKVSQEKDKRLVADNIAPNATVTYNAPVAENNGKVYYASDINGTITINEANFYASDVQILVTKNGVENTLSTSWTDDNTDVHVGRFTLVEEGEYIVKINYKDKSTNAMNEYVSELMVIDKTIEAPAFKINGVNKDGDNGGAYKENLNVAYEFSDQNFKSATTKLTKTRFDEKNDITEQYIKTTTTANGGNGTFDIAKDVDSDGIYLLEVSMSDYAGHTIDSFVKFTANRYGSVYEYSDYLAWIISDGGQFIKLTGDETVTEDLVITEYNPDMVENGSLNITATRDGEAFDVFFTTTPSDLSRSAEPSPNGWYKYVYTISKQNFKEDGTYKLSISSSDATGNTSISVPENSIDSYGNKILDVMGFTVDTTCPELKNIINLEDSVIRSSNLEVKYSIVDLGGIKSIEAYVDGQPVATAADLTVGLNNYNGSFFVGESDVAQEVRIVIEDIAGNVTDTDDAQWKQEQERAGSYVFKNPVTVSTNFMVLWLANKLVFFGSIGAASVLVIGGAIFIIAKKSR